MSLELFCVCWDVTGVAVGECGLEIKSYGLPDNGTNGYF